MPFWLSSSVVLASLVTALAVLQSHEKRVRVENVTVERAKWRERVRLKALEVHQAALANQTQRLSELVLEFGISLNPIDEDDLDILATIILLKTTEEKESVLSQFMEQIALLLKHDWERAKNETEPFWRRRITVPRIPHKVYKAMNTGRR